MSTYTYFDHNATTPPSEAAQAAWLEASAGSWRNPSSLYPGAAAVRRQLEADREELADRLGCDDPDRVVFTSGATEANNIVFAHEAAGGGAGAGAGSGAQEAASAPVALVSAVEHPSVLAPAGRWFGGDGRWVELPVAPGGTVDPAVAPALIERHRPALVSMMAANHETGVLQPWAEVRAACAAAGVRFHCDATQWVGKLPADGLGACDWLTGSAHKFGGPKGCGFLLVPADAPSGAFAGGQVGGPQESGRRGGTENFPAVHAMLAALREALAAAQDRAAPGHGGATAAEARDAFEARVCASIPGTTVVGAASPRLWNTSLLALPEYGNLKWLTRLADRGFEVSTGAACSSGRENPSTVLQAMGLGFPEMGRVLRFSAGRVTAAADWEALASALEATWEDLRAGAARPADPGRRRIDLGPPPPAPDLNIPQPTPKP